MTDEELWAAIDGLMAYDTGCTDSGIHDERLRAKVHAELEKAIRPNQMYSDRLSRLAGKYLLSEEAIADGSGLEDVEELINWLKDDA
jgi:hypothetical protein